MLVSQTRFFPAAGLAILATTAAPALAAFVDFNTPGQLAANFNIPSGTTTAQTFTEQTAGGVGGSGSVRPRDTDATAVYKTETFNLPVGGTFTTSMFVNKVSSTAAGSRMLQLGLGEAATDLFTTATGEFLSARVDTASDNTGRYVLVVQHRSGTTLTNLAQTTTPVALTGDRYYRFSVEIDRTGETTYTIEGSLVDYGTTGQTPGATVLSFSPVAVTNTMLQGVTSPALYAGFRSGYNAGAHRLDNFEAVVPEPASAALLTVGGLVAFARRR